MKKDFSTIMSECSDAKLIEITTKYRNDYQTEAVLAADRELEKRKLDIRSLQEAKNEIIKKEQQNKENAECPLPSSQKALFFLFSIGIIPILIAGTYKSKGFLRQYREAWRYMGYGFFSYFLLLVIILTVANI